MKKITKIKIGACLFGILHLALVFLSAVSGIALSFTGASVEEAPVAHALTWGIVLYFPLGLLGPVLLKFGLPDVIQFVLMGLNSILWGYVFYRILKYFAFKKENKKYGNNNQGSAE